MRQSVAVADDSQVSSNLGPCFLLWPPDDNLHVAGFFELEQHKELLSPEKESTS